MTKIIDGALQFENLHNFEESFAQQNPACQRVTDVFQVWQSVPESYFGAMFAS